MPRLRAVFGERDIRVDWKSLYRFQCARLDSFIHGRVIFIGDSAHVVSPFGARGGNGGIQDVDNLGWKLAEVLAGRSPETLLKTYDEERLFGTRENILNSSRATNFMTPKSATEKRYRDAVLGLAHTHSFAQKLINSGRLSVPCSLATGSLQTGSGAGRAMPDIPLENGKWLIEEAQGDFTLVGFGKTKLPNVRGLARLGIDQTAEYPCLKSIGEFAHDRYPAAVLLRPDGHIAAAFTKGPTAVEVEDALERARGNKLQDNQ